MATDIAWVLNSDPKYKDCVWFLTDDQSLENLNWGTTKNVEDNVIVAGNVAKVLRKVDY